MNRTEYERDICARSETASHAPFVPDVGFDGWEPAVSQCHDNVDHWVKHYPGYTAVRGWLSYASYGAEIVGYAAHSVVRGPDGRLFDITPLGDGRVERGSFIEHLKADTLFLAMQTQNLEIRCQGNCPAPHIDPGTLLQQPVGEAWE